MTARRSIQTNAERTSRAFQFVPGHVGGRVASAQPVTRRRTVGNIARPLGSAPDTVYIYRGSAYTVTAAPANVTHAAILHCESGNLATAAPPSGFTRIDSDTFGGYAFGTGPMTWQVVTAGAVVEGTVPVFTPGADDPDTYSYKEWIAVYFTGGSGGRLTLERGPHYDGTSYAEFNDSPPASATQWVYLGALKGVYNNRVTNVTGLGHTQGVVATYVYPSPGSYADPSTALAADAYLDWDGIGAYGSPGSQALCIGWIP